MLAGQAQAWVVGLQGEDVNKSSCKLWGPGAVMHGGGRKPRTRRAGRQMMMPMHFGTKALVLHRRGA